jgi:bla regulator protein blaR1
MTSWIVETLIATTVLMAIVLLIRRPVAARFGARAAYLLWLAPALRMILPPLPAHWFGAQAKPFQDAAIVVADVSSPLAIAPVVTGSGISWSMIATAIWLGGAAVYFFWHWLAYRNFARRILANARPIQHVNRIRVAASDHVTSPIAMGIWGRAIIVPDDFGTRFDGVEQRLALSHELTHHRRGDLPINFSALAILALHWFNPIAHLAYRAFRLDQEAACDAIVLDRASSAERYAYGRALMKAATGPVPLAICAMGASTQLKSRLRLIISGKMAEMSGRVKLIWVVLIAGGVVVTASHAVATQDQSEPVRAASPAELLVTNAVAKKPDGSQTQTKAGEMRRDLDDAVRAAKSDARKANDEAERGWREAEQGRREAEQGLREAEQAVIEARAIADSAGDVAIARAEANRARAEVQRAIAEVDRAFARDRQQRLDIAEPPAPPAPPAAPSRGTVPAEPPVPPSATSLYFGAAPALRTQAARVDCPKTARQRQIVSHNEGSTQVVVIDCDGRIAAFTNATKAEAIKSARSQIAGMAMLTQLQRKTAIEALDQAIAKMAIE